MINIGIIGTGFVAQLHLEAYQNMKDVEVKGIFDVNIEKAKETAQKFSTTVYSSADELISDKNIGVIVICVPTFLHEKFIEQCIQHRKHIFCEKPLTLSLKSSQKIIQDVKNSGLKLMVGHVLRFWPEYIKIKEYIDGQKLGKLKAIYASRLGQMPNWATWFNDPSKSGGALYDLHIHDIDFIIYLLGMPNSTSAIGYKNSQGAWNHIFSSLQYNNFPVLVEGSNQLSEGYPFTMQMRIVGEEATLEYVLKAGVNLEDIGSSIRELVLYSNGSAQRITIDPYDAYQSEFVYFIESIKNNTPLQRVELDSILQTMQTVDALESSLKKLS